MNEKYFEEFCILLNATAPISLLLISTFNSDCTFLYFVYKKVHFIILTL